MTTLDSIGTRTTLSNLASEIHLDIIARLPYDARASLRRANSYFHSLIPPFSHKDLLVAEREEYAAARDLLTCKYCLRLRHKSEFGDNMTKKKKARGGSENYNRFCVRCGLHPPLGCGAYSPGNSVKWCGQEFTVVFCVRCRKMELAEDDGTLGECRHSRKRRIDILRKQEEQERRVKRQAEREAWHRRMEEFLGSDTSSGGEFDDLDSNPDANWDNEST
ncbi:hypothetical protein M430DRAFT_201125 [Amorphotheca resinae ATCC 22711]|uniref:F-box domain-containing protein n=1 Tax=Amorphotheca resinae ATCC 22711 TaxID=857342 RepID=A0A2T3BAR1_AMORE|nr:hypothetical protein M430DRAFT_201125 [Amorphotheca resinae ATCC 22711]PSS25354.1 hypothetical protein M430DRAFT_201125 [Amorphotheca resinae ATCC 22711]